MKWFPVLSRPSDHPRGLQQPFRKIIPARDPKQCQKTPKKKQVKPIITHRFFQNTVTCYVLQDTIEGRDITDLKTKKQFRVVISRTRKKKRTRKKTTYTTALQHDFFSLQQWLSRPPNKAARQIHVSVNLHGCSVEGSVSQHRVSLENTWLFAGCNMWKNTTTKSTRISTKTRLHFMGRMLQHTKKYENYHEK